MRRKGADISPGDFAENITVEGIDLSVVSVGQKLHIADAVELEVTQLGKRCHGRCKIFEKLGDCIMPRQGVFARVTAGGGITVGDAVVADSGQDSEGSSADCADMSLRGAQRRSNLNPCGGRLLRSARND